MFLENIYHIKTGIVPLDFCNSIIAEGMSSNMTKSKIQDGNKDNRSSSVGWLDNKKLQTSLSNLIQLANDESNWNFSLKEFDPLQYSEYNKGDHYDWHIDSHRKPYDNGMIRKLSFTLCLNDDYEGGDFRISQPHPNSDKVVVESFKPKTGTMIVFPSHIWHKVGEVTKGTRKSLVGWVVGKQWQ